MTGFISRLALLLFTTVTVAARALPLHHKHENCSAQTSLWESLHYCAIATQPQKYQELCMPMRLYPSTTDGVGTTQVGTNNPNETTHQNQTTTSRIKKVKGVITMYHGFTACPDAFKEIAQEMVNLGFVVIVPLLPGMGLNLGYNCNSSPGICVSHGTNPSEIPTSKEAYFAWSRDILAITRQEADLVDAEDRADDFKILAMGLSVGGALAIYAAQQPDSPFQKVLTVNPYLSTTTSQLDFFIYKCTLTSDPTTCVSNQILKQTDGVNGNTSTKNQTSDANIVEGDASRIVNASLNTQSIPWQPLLHAATTATKDVTIWAVKNRVGRLVTQNYPDFLQSVWEVFSALSDHGGKLFTNPLFDAEIGWGERCSANTKRGGICFFRVRHLIALQAFVEYVVGNVERVGRGVEYANIHSEMDGYVRGSVSKAVLKVLKKGGNQVARCRFLSECGIEEVLASQSLGDNTCGIDVFILFTIVTIADLLTI